ncbi:MAG: hypothetical protein M1509_03765 [Nitrospirae bacterium]|nr:hypothetical protein [Nitrospirota bacterium]MDA8111620.1 hypothetical protein [Nitrospiraceae bacterium]
MVKTWGGRIAAGILLFVLLVAESGGAGRGFAASKTLPDDPVDDIDRIVGLLPSPSGFSDVRELFLRYGLRVSSARVAHGGRHDAIVVRLDFFLPVPPHCHPTEDQRRQYYLERAVWRKSPDSDSFVPVNSWSRHISLAQTDWFENIPCYP